MDSLEYVQRLADKIQRSFEEGEEMPWSDRIKKYGDEVEAEAKGEDE